MACVQVQSFTHGSADGGQMSCAAYQGRSTAGGTWPAAVSSGAGVGVVDFSSPGWNLSPGVLLPALKDSDSPIISRLSLDTDTDTDSSSESSPTPRASDSAAGLRQGSDSASGLLQGTVSSSSEGSLSKRKRSHDCSGTRLPRAKSPREKRGVAWGTEDRVRCCDTSNTSPTGQCPHTDTRAGAKSTDGPSRTSLLMDKLVVSFFESGVLHIANDVITLLGVGVLNEHGKGVIARLQGICHSLNVLGRNVGLLPSNVRLGSVHAPHLLSLLDIVVDACAIAKCCAEDERLSDPAAEESEDGF